MDLKEKAKIMELVKKHCYSPSFQSIKHSFTEGYHLVKTIQNFACLSLDLQPYFYKFAHLFKNHKE
jgi:hypothetical protein